MSMKHASVGQERLMLALRLWRWPNLPAAPDPAAR